MTIIRGVSSVIFAGMAAVALAGPAWAAPVFEGDYTFTGAGITRPWHATSCGLSYPCSHIDAPPVAGKAGFGGDAKIAANTPFWILGLDNLPGTVVCADGSSAPGNIKYQWNIDTLSGSASTWTTVGVCGDPPKSYGSFSFTLTKAS